MVIGNCILDVRDNAIYLNGSNVTDCFVYENYIRGNGEVTDVGIFINGGDANVIIGNSVGECVTAGTHSDRKTFKRKNDGEFGIISHFLSSVLQ